jgi:hypothetical protein
MRMLLTFYFTCHAFFGLAEFGPFVSIHAFFPERLFNHCKGFRCTVSEICTKFDTVPFSGPMWNPIRPVTRLQRKLFKKISTSTQLWNCVHWHPIYASTIIFCRIALVQLLYRWQHQSRKLWISPLRRVNTDLSQMWTNLYNIQKNKRNQWHYLQHRYDEKVLLQYLNV